MKTFISNAIVAGLMLSGAAVADIINVPADYLDVQDAIEASSDGDLVLIAPGVYTGEINFYGKAIEVRGSLGPDGEHLTTIDAEYVYTTVLFTNGEQEDSILSQLVITGGGNVVNGGGIECNGTSPTIIDCVITGNVAQDAAGIFCRAGAAPAITNCLIENNVASGSGAGILVNLGSSPLITNCEIIGNSANANQTGRGVSTGYGSGGGGFYSLDSDPTLVNCRIEQNVAFRGAGLFCTGGGEFIGCQIVGNSANLNSSSTRGGGVYSYGSRFVECLITGNTSTLGGGMYLGGATLIEDCVIQGNNAQDGGGIYGSPSGGPIVMGTAICANTPNQISGLWSDEGGNSLAAICPVPGACCTNGICVMSEEDDCDTFGGDWLGEGTTCADSPCPSACLGDADGNGGVDIDDILLVIARFGVTCP